MMLKSKFLVLTFFLSFGFTLSHAQDTRDYDQLDPYTESEFQNGQREYAKLVFFDYRGTNAFDVSFGAATLATGDTENNKYGFYYRLGYKRYILDHFAVGVSYNNYKLSYSLIDQEEIEIEQQLNSIDFNFEYIVLPYDEYTPFFYAGFGYNALDSFEVSSIKLQLGFGMEYIVTDKLGVRLFGEYNHSMDDDMEFLINDQDDDTIIRVGAGLNFYFGGSKERERRLESIPTVIKSNLIEEE